MSSDTCREDQLNPCDPLESSADLSKFISEVNPDACKDLSKSNVGLAPPLNLLTVCIDNGSDLSSNGIRGNRIASTDISSTEDNHIASLRLGGPSAPKAVLQDDLKELENLYSQTKGLGGFSTGASLFKAAKPTYTATSTENIEDELENIFRGRAANPKTSLFQTASSAAGALSGVNSFSTPYSKTNRCFKAPEKRRREDSGEEAEDASLGNHEVKRGYGGSAIVSTPRSKNDLPASLHESLAQECVPSQFEASNYELLHKRQRAELETPSIPESIFIKPSNLAAPRATKPSSILSLKMSNIKRSVVAAPFQSPMRRKPIATDSVKAPTHTNQAQTQNPITRMPKNLLTVLYESCGELPVTRPASVLAKKLNRITILTASQVRFKETEWGLKEAKAEFLKQGADEAWISNHYAQIVWKLACLIKSYSACQSRWSALQVRKELSHRLKEEKQMKRSSVIKAIVEQELKPCFYFVAVVSRVAKEGFFISDGWYEAKCTIDAPLQRALAAQRIFVGQKLGICGAELKSPGPMPVLEGLLEASLSLSSNGVRRARWDARLGSRPAPFFPVQISNIHADGGVIPFVEATVVRKYPLKFLTKTDDGNVVRSYDEELAYRESNSMSDFESTPFFSIRLIDGGAREAILTVWRACLTRYQSLTEGKRYQFFNLAPSSSQKDKTALEVVSTNNTSWTDSVQAGHVLPSRNALLISQLAALPDSTEVDLIVGYLGAALNGFTFIDSSCRLLVIRPPPSQKNTFVKLKVGCIIGLENFKVAGYFSKFDLQALDFGYNSVVRSDAAFEFQQSSLRLYLDEQTIGGRH
ncbi:hypothetical protein DSO57_1015380 [Entomophthora muscae]|uniref:Uncharacterized protein n=1 Tax=Entomophthora muscae TaxID=34485 RepID=A0ACC2RWD7_9FUNG|nr:hypothetical protein DSO57_1015380 [Entomophthora muscae]